MMTSCQSLSTSHDVTNDAPQQDDYYDYKPTSGTRFFLENKRYRPLDGMQLDQHRRVGQKQGLKCNSGNDKNPSPHVGLSNL